MLYPSRFTWRRALYSAARDDGDSFSLSYTAKKAGKMQTCQPSRIERGNPRIETYPRIHARLAENPRIDYKGVGRQFEV